MLTVEEVADRVNATSPLGAFHLTVADAEQAQAFHLFQHETKENEHVIREMTSEKPLVVANCYYLSEDDKTSWQLEFQQ